MRRGALLVGAILVLGVAGAPAATRSGTVVKSALNAKLKQAILVDSRGRTLYAWTADTATSSACVNDPVYHCSKDWPPLLTTDAPKAGPGVKASLLATFTRDDGGTQVTYAHHPLYTWRGYGGVPGDRKPGDLHGQGYIGGWWVVSPSGKLIKRMPHT